MLDITQSQSESAQSAALKNKQVLRYREDERMAGKVAVWSTEKTAKEEVSQKLALAENNPTKTFDQALAYANSRIPAKQDEVFGFGDIIDMANPLHHVPLVGDVYRRITGDEIKPVSRVIGGAAFGGAAGAAGSLMNVVVEHETGKDIAGNVWSMVKDGQAPEYRTAGLKKQAAESRTATRPNHVQDDSGQDEAVILAVADLGGGRKRITETVAFNEGRSAGQSIHIREDMPFLGAKRQPITDLKLAPMPASYNDYE